MDMGDWLLLAPVRNLHFPDEVPAGTVVRHVYRYREQDGVLVCGGVARLPGDSHYRLVCFGLPGWRPFEV